MHVSLCQSWSACRRSRFPLRPETATPDKMSLTAPKRTPAGYFLELTAPVSAPAVKWTTDGKWAITPEWLTWATEIRQQLLGQLLSHGTWFSRPPRRDVLEPLFSPWAGIGLQGVQSFFCTTPNVPGAASSGTATWNLTGILMSTTAITPVWTLGNVTEDEKSDLISLFGDAETVEGSDEEETREIQLEEIETAPGPAPRMRNREWEARKFLSKERVREARLKAQVAIHLARKEEARFFRLYGDLEDGESHFSDYDLSDTDTGSSSSSEEEESHL